MTKRMGLMALGLSMVLLSGCDSTDDIVNNIVDDIVDDTGVLNTPAVVEKNIVGEWLTACHSTDNGGSEIDRVIFVNDGTGQYEGAEYFTPGCNEADINERWEGTFTYTIGEATTGSAGEDAVELDIVVDDVENYYTMANFTTVDAFNMASSEDGDTNDGATLETRENVFHDWPYTRQ